jgi:sulfite reductase alpha subunit-like flavoprotein
VLRSPFGPFYHQVLNDCIAFCEFCTLSTLLVLQRCLENEKFVMVLVSTFGEGSLPDNAQAFYNFLAHADPGFCDNIEYAVCAFGSSDYTKFCEAGKQFDAIFEKVGAKRITTLVECDENSMDRYGNPSIVFGTISYFSPCVSRMIHSIGS